MTANREASGVDELELVRRFYGQGRLTDPSAHRRALAQLRRAARPRRLHRVALIAAAATAVVVVVAIPWYAGLRPGTDRRPRNTAAAELHHLAGIAGGHELAAGERPVVYEHRDELQTRGFTDLETGVSYTIEVLARVEIWRSPDGSLRSATDVLEAHFASERDRVIWEEAGRPPIPEPGPEATQTLPPGEIPFPDLGELPLDPAALLDQLRRGWWPNPLDSDEETLLAIGELLARGDAEPALRRVLFEAAATLDGAELLGERPDPLGRSGIAIGLGPTDRRVVLIVDPTTSVLLWIEERAGTFVSWRAYTAWATVGALGVRPDAADLS
jgi:hypothetical protein